MNTFYRQNIKNIYATVQLLRECKEEIVGFQFKLYIFCHQEGGIKMGSIERQYKV